MNLMNQEDRRRIVQAASRIVQTVEPTPAGQNVHVALGILMQAIDSYRAEQGDDVDGDRLADELLGELTREHRARLGRVPSESLSDTATGAGIGPATIG